MSKDYQDRLYDLMDERFNRFEQQMGSRFEKIDSRLTSLEAFKWQVVGVLLAINIAWEMLKEKILPKG